MYIHRNICEFSHTIQLKNEDIELYDFGRDSETLAYILLQKFMLI